MLAAKVLKRNLSCTLNEKGRNKSTRRLAGFLPAASSDHSCVCECVQNIPVRSIPHRMETKRCRLLSVRVAVVSFAL